VLNTNAVLKTDDDRGGTNIVAGSSDSYTEATRTFTWNTNAGAGTDVSTWSGYDATQMVDYAFCVAHAGVNGWASSATNGTNVGTASWADPEHVITNGGIDYSGVNLIGATTSSYDLVLTNFGFSIDSGDVIVGVAARVISFYGTPPPTGGVFRFSLYVDGSAIDSGYTNTSYRMSPTTNITTNTIGGSSSLWGTTLTPAQVNASGFGVGMVATYTNTKFNPLVDEVMLIVYSTTQGTNWSVGATTNDEFDFNYQGTNKFRITSSGVTLGGNLDFAGFQGSNLGSITSTNVLAGKSLSLTGGDSGKYLKGDGTEGDPNQFSYQPYNTIVTPDAGGTCTIAYADGGAIQIDVTTNITIWFDNTAYPTNGINRVAVDVWSLTNTVAFVDANVTNATALIFTNKSPASLFFRKSGTNILWHGRQ